MRWRGRDVPAERLRKRPTGGPTPWPALPHATVPGTRDLSLVTVPLEGCELARMQCP